MGIIETLAILLYLGITGYLGFLGYKQTKDETDYLLAGRNTHPFVMAMSYGATFISTAAIVGFGGVAAWLGQSLLWLAFCNIFVGVFIAFVFLGNPTRKLGYRLNAHTFPELLGKRYDSKGVQLFGGLLITTFMPLYAAAVLIGGDSFCRRIFQNRLPCRSPTLLRHHHRLCDRRGTQRGDARGCSSGERDVCRDDSFALFHL